MRHWNLNHAPEPISRPPQFPNPDRHAQCCYADASQGSLFCTARWHAAWCKRHHNQIRNKI